MQTRPLPQRGSMLKIREVNPAHRPLSDLNKPLEELEKRERDRLIAGPYGRGRLHLRGARFVKFARKRGAPRQYGLRLLRNTGFANLGDHTFFLHATKGWRRVTTPGLAASIGRTLGHWMIYRNDLIHATKTGDDAGVEQAKRAFKRSLDL